MHLLIDTKAIEEASALWPDPEIRKLLSINIERLRELGGYELSQFINVAVMEHTEAASDLDAVLGFSIMTNRFDGCRYDEPGFIPSWEFIEEHTNWFEMVYVISDDGFGVVVFISKNVTGELLKMLQQYAHQ